MTRVHNILHNMIRLYGVNVKLQTTDGGSLMNRIRMGCQTQKRTISHNVLYDMGGRIRTFRDSHKPII